MSDPVQDPRPASPRPRTRLWVRLLLFASLALNLLIVGAIGGAVLGNRPHVKEERPAQLVRELGLGPYLRALDIKDRQALRKAAESRKGELRQSRVALRRQFAETVEVLEAEELDQPRLEALIAAQAETAGRGREIGQELLLERISAMSLAERQALAEKLKRALRRPPPGHKPKGQKPAQGSD